MSPRTLRRLVTGFAAGILVGWVGGLLRSPRSAPAGSSAADAATLPQERFGQPAGEPVPQPPAPQVGGSAATVDVSAYDAGARPEPAMSAAPSAGAPEAPASAARRGASGAARKPAKKAAASKPAAAAKRAKPAKPAKGSAEAPATKPVKGTTTATGAGAADTPPPDDGPRPGSARGR